MEIEKVVTYSIVLALAYGGLCIAEKVLNKYKMRKVANNDRGTSPEPIADNSAE